MRQHLDRFDLDRRPSSPHAIQQPIGEQAARSNRGFVVGDLAHTYCRSAHQTSGDDA
jgi:hypothetical protein